MKSQSPSNYFLQEIICVAIIGLTSTGLASAQASAPFQAPWTVTLGAEAGGTIGNADGAIHTSFGRTASGPLDIQHLFAGFDVAVSYSPNSTFSPNFSPVFGTKFRVYLGDPGSIDARFHFGPGNDTSLSYGRDFMFMPYVGFTFPVPISGTRGASFTPYVGWIIERGQMRFITDERSGGGIFNSFRDDVTRQGVGLGVNVDVPLDQLFKASDLVDWTVGRDWQPFVGANAQVSVMSGQSHRYTTPAFGLGYDTSAGSNVELRSAVRVGVKFGSPVGRRRVFQ